MRRLRRQNLLVTTSSRLLDCSSSYWDCVRGFQLLVNMYRTKFNIATVKLIFGNLKHLFMGSTN